MAPPGFVIVWCELLTTACSVEKLGPARSPGAQSPALQSPLHFAWRSVRDRPIWPRGHRGTSTPSLDCRPASGARWHHRAARRATGSARRDTRTTSLGRAPALDATTAWSTNAVPAVDGHNRSRRLRHTALLLDQR